MISKLRISKRRQLCGIGLLVSCWPDVRWTVTQHLLWYQITDIGWTHSQPRANDVYQFINSESKLGDGQRTPSIQSTVGIHYVISGRDTPHAEVLTINLHPSDPEVVTRWRRKCLKGEQSGPNWPHFYAHLRDSRPRWLIRVDWGL